MYMYGMHWPSIAASIASVWYRCAAGKLAFSVNSSPGTAKKASEVYKRIVAGDNLITSICRDFPEKLSQEVVTMSMSLMTPPETKKR
jgi:hypothetical protein